MESSCSLQIDGPRVAHFQQVDRDWGYTSWVSNLSCISTEKVLPDPYQHEVWATDLHVRTLVRRLQCVIARMHLWVHPALQNKNEWFTCPLYLAIDQFLD